MTTITTENYTLHCGDCLEYLRSMEKGSVDAVMIADPPYEIKNKFGSSDLYGTRVMEFSFDLAGVTDIVLRVFREVLLCCRSYHTFCEFEQYGKIADLAREIGFTPKPFVKVKLCPPPPMPGNWWTSGVECAQYGYRPSAYFGDKSAKRPNVITADSYRHGIRAGEKENHPTQKWLPMIRYIVETLTRPGDLVIDPFMGSGTTGVAALQLGRRFIGCELDAGYFAIAQRRIENAAAQPLLIPPAPAPASEQLAL